MSGLRSACTIRNTLRATSSAALPCTTHPRETTSSTRNSSTRTICLRERRCSRTWSVWDSTKTSHHNKFGNRYFAPVLFHGPGFYFFVLFRQPPLSRTIHKRKLFDPSTHEPIFVTRAAPASESDDAPPLGSPNLTLELDGVLPLRHRRQRPLLYPRLRHPSLHSPVTG